MKKKKILLNTENPEFIIRKENGAAFLEVKLPKKLRKEMENMVLHVSGAIPST